VLTRFLEPKTDAAYAVMRIALGLMFTFHGAQKILGVLSTSQPPAFSQIWFGGIIELVGGTLIALGAFTRCAAFVASGTMAVAYTQFHWKLSFGSGLLPAINKGELALVYAFVLLYIACRGAGIWSVDDWRKKRAR
jgi:putative oxidoreductase